MSKTNKIKINKSKTKQEGAISPVQKKERHKTVDSLVSRVLHLQRTIGNRAVRRLFKSGNIQAKLKIGKPNDKYEQEADRVADQVMRMPEPKILRQTEEKEEELVQPKPIAGQITPLVQRQAELEEEEEPIQAKGNISSTAEVTTGIESSINSLKGSGQLLSESTRNYFEPRFGANFEQVRIHNNSQAANIAGSINAKAFTTGKDIAFGKGQYSPETSGGKYLLAHELTHVIQSSRNTVVMRTPAADNRTKWMKRAKALIEAAQCEGNMCRQITVEREREFINLINDVASDLSLAELHLPVENYRLNRCLYKVDHVYFDRELREVFPGVTTEVFKSKSGCPRLNEPKRPGEKRLGFAIVLGPGIIRETPEHTKYVLEHEYVHLMRRRNLPYNGPQTIKSFLAEEFDEELIATVPGFKYLFAFSDNEISAHVAYYLKNYVFATESVRNAVYVQIFAFLSNPESVIRSPDDVVKKLLEIEQSGEVYNLVPDDFRGLAAKGIEDIIEAIKPGASKPDYKFKLRTPLRIRLGK